VTSFDGTVIRIHWFPAADATTSHPDPTVLMGPGWGMSGATKSSSPVLGGGPVTTFNNAGYNVLTWDPRGFGQSSGTIEVDSRDYEARDVSRLIDWVATQTGVELDAPGDPRMGMVGGSYGGGIQFTTAAQDCRVDAIVPEIAWHSLSTSLDKADTAKTGWGNLLYIAAPTSHLDPAITQAYQDSNSIGLISAADRQWFIDRGPGDLVAKVKIPTLIVQGTVDTLFTLEEGVTNYQILRAHGIPVHMVWFCGGHGVCLTNQGDPNYVQRATLQWLDRWVKRDSSVSIGPAVDIIDQTGTRYAAASYPTPSRLSIRAEGNGTLNLVDTGGSGPASIPEENTDPLGPIVKGITPSEAANSVNVTIHAPGTPSLVVGAPQASFTYQGTASNGPRPTRVFAQLVDDNTRLVLGNQVTPIDVTLDGRVHTISVRLEIVAQTLKARDSLTLQLVATTVAYASPRLRGSVTFSNIKIGLPVVDHPTGG
jgi:ABC-2 type transport system ATP-binding protein